jgi:hypothetical protein
VGEDDENPPPTTGTTQTQLNATQNGPSVRPQPNVLDKYSSYTYVASVYLCTQAQYTKLLGGTDKKIDGYQLLFQSGGAPTSDGTIRPNQVFTQQDPKDPTSVTSSWQNYAQAPRNPFFDSDFYIDAITLETVPTGKGTGAAHMNATLKFTVVEPLGITLLNRLYKAVQNFAPNDGTNKVNYTSAIYLMVIRFYGYDQAGNLVMPIRGGLQTPGETSDPKAVVEKLFRSRSIVSTGVWAANWSHMNGTARPLVNCTVPTVLAVPFPMTYSLPTPLWAVCLKVQPSTPRFKHRLLILELPQLDSRHSWTAAADKQQPAIRGHLAIVLPRQQQHPHPRKPSHKDWRML